VQLHEAFVLDVYTLMAFVKCEHVEVQGCGCGNGWNAGYKCGAESVGRWV